jgi:NADPH2:quinone reductase
MKAIRVHAFGGPDVLQLDELPDPKPGPNQVLMRVRAAGVNPVDTYIRSGKYPSLPTLPYTPGTDAAGTIEAVGEGVANWKIDDRVYCDRLVAGYGSYATHALVDANHLYRLPENVSFALGAGVNVPYGTAYRALFHRAKPKPGETVLVHGATGGVGIAAVQLAVAHGCVVIGTGGTEHGRQLVRQQGAAHVLDHKSAGYLDQLMKLTGGQGVNVIIEMLANVNLDKDLGVLAKFGRVVIVGNRGRVEIDPRQTMGKESSILGMNYWAGGEPAVNEAQRAIVAGLANGSLKPIVDHEYPLAEAAKAHEDVIGEGSGGKIVLDTAR